MKQHKDVTEKAKQVEQEIYSLMGKEIPSLFNRREWKGKLMEWAMRDDSIKVPLFRFVDALPCLKTDPRVVGLLHEYFTDVESSPLMIRRGIGTLSGTGILPGLAGKMIRARVASFGRQFIAGQDPKEAFHALSSLRKQGLGFTVDLLGEAVLSDTEAERYRTRYLDLLDFLGTAVKAWPDLGTLDRDDRGPIPRLDVSLKVSSFYSQLDPVDWEGSIENTRRGLSPVFERAKEVNASVTVDMEHYHVKDLTIAVFKAVMEDHQDLDFGGLALQTYLHDTEHDLAELIQWAKARKRRIFIRLVKGAYWDYETVIHRQRGWPVPVFLEKEQTDANFDRLVRIALENIRHVRPAIATHNVANIGHAVAVADALRLPSDALEFQVIYGMAEPVRTALQKMGYRVRVYTPIGELIPGMAYLIRRLLENTSNESFLRKAFFEPPHTQKRHTPALSHPVRSAPRTEISTFQNEPLVDFSRFENRKEMHNALQAMRKEFDRKYPLVIAGREIRTMHDILSINPAKPDEIVGRVCSATVHEARTAVEEARTAWSSWKETPPEERAGCLFRAAELMRQQRFELMALEVYEVGKTWKEADADIAEAIDFLEYYAREMVRLGTPRKLGHYRGEMNHYICEPRGVGVVISPWNFPIAIPTGMVSAGIVTGNCVIFKPSGLSPVSGWKLVEIFGQGGLPPGVLQFVPGPGSEVGEYLVTHPQIDFIAFTGSKEVGLRIVEHAAQVQPGQRSIKKVVAELGGKNAIIIDETADLDEAVKGVLDSALSFQGQKCSACSRAIVVGDLFDRFCGRLKEAMESIAIGPPDDPRTFMGPLIDEQAKKKVQTYAQMGKKHGKVIFARDVPGDGYYVGPTIIADVDTDSPIAQEEIFGPVLAVMRAGDMEQALAIANGTVQALTGGIYSRSPANIRKAQRGFCVGNVYINRKITGALVGRQPFGGFGMSGVGSKAGGPDYLLQFMNMRSISENTLRRGFAPDQGDVGA